MWKSARSCAVPRPLHINTNSTSTTSRTDITGAGVHNTNRCLLTSLQRQRRPITITHRRYRDELESAIERTEHVLPEEMESWITFRDISVSTILKSKAKRGIWPPARPGAIAIPTTEKEEVEEEEKQKAGEAEEARFIPLSAIAETSTVYDAVTKMYKTGFGAVVILRADSKQNLELQANGQTPIHLTGIFTERDFLTKVFRLNKSPKMLNVTEVMTTNVKTVDPTTTAARCMDLMTTQRFRHLPVVDHEGLARGIISIGDIVKYILDEQRQTIHFLKEYIQRTY